MTADDMMSAEGFLHELTAEQLVERAVCNSRPPNRIDVRSFRWESIQKTFGLGSTYSRDLCVKFGLDPYEVV